MRRTTTWGSVALSALSLTIAGCAARAAPAVGAARAGAAAFPVEKQEKFALGLAEMARHERAGDWTEPTCKETVALLLGGGAAPVLDGAPAAASYDAGLVQRRCGKEAEARKLFEAALAKNPAFHPARTALARGLASDAGGLDRAVAELSRSVRDARFSDATALVALATVQMQRGGTSADDEGTGDLDRARQNLHRALAIDDASMPALNQLALLHLSRARGAPSARSQGKKAATQALEMAALVCAQAIAKNPRWAPLHNTAGLVEVELGNLSRAAAAFDEARRLDPRLVEAQMNLAALNLEVRGFARAEEAYRAVLALRTDDYDAHVGLALAIRGQIDETNEPERVAAATKELERAEQLAPDRPEAWFNQAILVQEYGSRAAARREGPDSLTRAKGLYERFLAKADGAPAFAEARERAKGRLQDIQQIAELESRPPQP
jgi:Tfp pilus assembly protein PilF